MCLSPERRSINASYYFYYVVQIKSAVLHSVWLENIHIIMWFAIDRRISLQDIIH